MPDKKDLRDPEKIGEYLDGVISAIEKAKKDPNNWKVNETYHSQLMVRTVDEEGQNAVHTQPSEELQ